MPQERSTRIEGTTKTPMPAEAEPGAGQVLATGVRMGFGAMRRIMAGAIVLIVAGLFFGSIYMEIN